MAYLNREGVHIELAEDWRVGELIEAENALDIDMDEARGAAKRALIAYISVRRHVGADFPKGVLADEILRMNLTDVVNDDEEEEAAAPLDDVPEEGDEETENGEGENGGQPTTGHRLSVPSA